MLFWSLRLGSICTDGGVIPAVVFWSLRMGAMTKEKGKKEEEEDRGGGRGRGGGGGVRKEWAGLVGGAVPKKTRTHTQEW